MGRVSKYKKVKAIDPFAPASRAAAYFKGVRASGSLGRSSKRKSAEHYDLPNGEGDDFAVDEFGNVVDAKVGGEAKGGKKKVKGKALILLGGRGAKPMQVGWQEDTTREKDIFDVAYDEMGSYKMKSLEKSIGKSSMIEPMIKNKFNQTASSSSSSNNKVMFKSREEGESMRAFNRRIKNDTGLALKEDLKPQPTSVKRKEYLKNKKLKKKGLLPSGGGGGGGEGDEYIGNEATHGGAVGGRRRAGEDSDDDDGREVDFVEFGEQAMRPPEIKVVPRIRKKIVGGVNGGVIVGGGKRKEESSGGESDDAASESDEDEEQKSSTMDEEKGKSTKNTKKKSSAKDNATAMELLRQRVQESYKAMKAKKRGKFDFGAHL